MDQSNNQEEDQKIKQEPRSDNLDNNNTDNNIKGNDESEKTPIYKYILYGLCVVALLLLCYYAYNRFIANSDDCENQDDQQQEANDELPDYNLREAINNLETMQHKILKNLSGTTGI